MRDQTSYQINDVFVAVRPIEEVDGTVRVIYGKCQEHVVIINIEPNRLSAPYSIPYERWIELVDGEYLQKVVDPYINVTSAPTGLPTAAVARLKSVIEATTIINQNPCLLHEGKALSKEIASIAEKFNYSHRNVKRWIFEWLRAGRNPAVVVLKFINGQKRNLGGMQAKGKKRGVRATKSELVSDAPAHEIEKQITKAYTSYVVEHGMPWKSAYYEMLIKLYGVPVEAISEAEAPEALLTPALVVKFRLPSWPQFRYRCRRLKRQESVDHGKMPRGKRGNATDNVAGPGYFEIDATHFQIQLVSCITKSALVGRPTVYLIVDIYSNVITGYAVTLENPSWAIAALALYNAFSDKGPVFKRLGLTFTSEDWPCRHLPTMLRADRAELVSNMGQDFPASGIRVEVTPSMTPIAKGTVEGKHSEAKQTYKSRFNIPGLFSKFRKRRETDGKKKAALNLLEFERILVEVIMDLNGRAVSARRLPPDALKENSHVASRIGFYEWALQHRPGFTSNMRPNFVYEHLLTKATGRVTSAGIKVHGEIFNCDRLRELGYLRAALNGSFDITVSYNPTYAGEIFFFEKNNSWVAATNIDQEILRIKPSFFEAKEFRAHQNKFTEQASLTHHAKQRTRSPKVSQIIRSAVNEKNLISGHQSRSKSQIRENRLTEKAVHRGPHLTGADPTTCSPVAAASATKNPAGTSMIDEISIKDDANVQSESERPNSMSMFHSLWSKVNAGNK